MAENTAIEWADHTFNPWTGCTKVSDGCDLCYAEGWSKRAGAKVGKWGPGMPRVRTTPANWRQPLKWNAQAAAEGRRFRVFCASLADVFDNEVDPQWRFDLFALIDATPHLDWLLLTKRIGNVVDMLPGRYFGRLPHNVWLGATICHQKEADRDIPKLLSVPAAKRFLSMEPLLGPVSFEGLFANPGNPADGTNVLEALDWIIVGGESGPGARPMHPDWARSLRDQCAAAGAAFLFKQWGEWHTSAFIASTGEPVFRQFDCHQQWVNKARTWVNGGICLDRHGKELRNGGDMARARDQGNFPVTIMHRVGKKAAGRLLDGRTWDGVPS
ncbi:phage Gp37/Gp68 family protein [Pseudacidovorax intermedius]|uniref:phage Gp37/Gp68 family protein n=1 Tax=Pseudacidovorax intermedius TaxID=433924 RepID=UPI0026ECFEAA|nr:phage Gp37/Gp68 family protein [Pseudacidovorax intermedius]